MILPIVYDKVNRPTKWLNPKYIVSVEIIEHDIKNIEIVFIMVSGTHHLKFNNRTKWNEFKRNELQTIVNIINNEESLVLKEYFTETDKIYPERDETIS